MDIRRDADKTRKGEAAVQAREPEWESFFRFIANTIDHLIDSLTGLSEEELNWRPPAPETNSPYAIAMHVLGNAEANVLGVLCGLPVQRERETEFAATGRSATDVRERWLGLKERMREAVVRLPDGGLDRVVRHPRRGSLAGREVLLVVARHAAEHWGEAQLTLNLMKAWRVSGSIQRG